MEVANRLDHRQRAAGEDSVRAAGDTVPEVHVEPTEAVRTVAVARAGHRVGDERDATAADVPDELGRVGSEVVAVEDHLDDDVVTRERDAGNAGIPVVERAHGVEEVRDGVHPEVEGGVRLECVRIRVTAGHRDAALVQQVDERVGAGQLGRQRDEPHRTGREQPLEQLGVGIAARRLGMRAQPRRGKKRPFEVGAEDVRAFEPFGISASAATSCSSGAVMKVGRYAVTPVSSIAWPATR